MSNRQIVWVDGERCNGCGACVEVCPVGAMALVADKACVDEEACTGCQACVDACPLGAVQPLVHGEIVTVREASPPAVQRTMPLSETAGVAVAAAGVSVLAGIAGRLARAVGHWLGQRLTEDREAALTPSPPGRRKPLGTVSGTGMTTDAASPVALPDDRGRTGRGRQARRRHRGR
jgi:NAD-dependent dihydropyrimidine dehydrogenase PreA subunit